MFKENNKKMIKQYRFLVQREDSFGHQREIEFMVIAQTEDEAQEEIKDVFSHHDEIIKWEIIKNIEERTLRENDSYYQDYVSKGAHSYYSGI